MKLVRTPSLFHSRNSLLNPSRLFRNFVFLFSLVGLGSLAWGDQFEVLFQNGNTWSDELTINQNEIAELISLEFYLYNNSSYAYVEFQGEDGVWKTILQTRTPLVSSNKIVIPGPCKLRCRQTYNSGSYWSRGLVNVKNSSTENTTAKYATVIPENAKTNVSVILEQSTDLVNWTAANPGDFTPSTSKRFFRVRTANVPVAITGASNAAPIVISSASHGLSTGDAISVSGVAGNTAANGVFTITKVDDNSFSLNGATGNAAYTSGGTWLPSP